MNDRSRPTLSTYLPSPLRALLWIRLYILLLPSWKVRVFSIMILVYGDETLTLHPPPIWKTRCCDLSVFSPKNCSAQLKPSGTKVPTGIAFRITMACRPRHHIKAQLLRSWGAPSKNTEELFKHVWSHRELFGFSPNANLFSSCGTAKR